MLRQGEKTVFVLGAGASCDLMFPSGEKLKREILKLAESCQKNAFQQAILYQSFHHQNNCEGGADSRVKKAANRVEQRLKNLDSIDAFIEQNANDTNLVLFSKLAIIQKILEAEHSAGSLSNNTWYQALFTALINGIPSEMGDDIFSDEWNPLTVITFNYDRSFEQYFYQKLREHFDLSETSAATAMSKLKIHHVYGRIAPLKWQDKEAGWEFGETDSLSHCPPSANQTNAAVLANNIRTYHEGCEHFEEIQEVIKDADHLYFMGFGFHPMNMNVLFGNRIKDSLEKCRTVIATAKGMPALKQKSIDNTFSNLIKKSNPLIVIGGETDNKEWDCNALMAQIDYLLRGYKINPSVKVS